MEIKKVISDKKEFLELLLLADEQESMIDRYLERGDMFVLYDNGLKACCVVTREGEGIYEIKNIATISFFQRQGYGKRLIQFLFDHYRGKCSELLVGTGDVPSTLSFLRTLWLHHFPSAKEFLYRQLRPSYVRRRQATGDMYI